MEKMNQVSVSEFFAKSNEERYDMAVEMVEKYNRIVDICNDSAERMAELVERHKVYTNALNKDIADKAAKIDLLEKEIEGRKEGYTALKELMDTKYISIEKHNNICNTYEKKVAELKKELEGYKDRDENAKELINNNAKEINKLNRFLKMQEDLTRNWKNKYVEAQKEIDEWESDSSEYETIIQYQELIDGLNKDLSYWKEAFETQATSLADVRKLNNELVDTLDKSNDEIEKLEKQVKYLEKELDKTCTCKELDLKGHQSRETALVNTLADKNDLIKNLVQEIDYYKNQERIRTDQLRATESKVEELWKEIEKFTKGETNDHGRAGFTEYIKYIIAEEEGKFKAELNKRFSEEVSKISQKRTEEELAKVKGVGRTSSGRYPWGAKTIRCTKPNSFHCIYGDDCPVEAAEKCKFAKEENNIPCGEDAIE